MKGRFWIIDGGEAEKEAENGGLISFLQDATSICCTCERCIEWHGYSRIQNIDLFRSGLLLVMGTIMMARKGLRECVYSRTAQGGASLIHELI